MLKIGEFSKLTQISIRMLRYYDETGLLKPAEINKNTGYRMYSAKQIKTLNRILFLRDIGFNVSEISDILNNWNKQYLKKQLQVKEKETMKNIKEKQERLLRINKAVKDMDEESISREYNYEVIIKTIPTYHVVSFREIVPNYFYEGSMWEKLCRYINDNRLNISESNYSFAIYNDKEYKEKDVDIEVCVVTEEDGISSGAFSFRETEAVEKAACIMVYGQYENIAPAYNNFAYWLSNHDNYNMVGSNRQICHKGPWNEKDKDKYVTELQIPIEIKSL